MSAVATVAHSVAERDSVAHRYIDVFPGDIVEISGPATIEAVRKTGSASRLLVSASRAVSIRHDRAVGDKSVRGVEY